MSLTCSNDETLEGKGALLSFPLPASWPLFPPCYFEHHPPTRVTVNIPYTMGSKTKSQESDSSAVADAIIDTVRASDNGKSMELKSLRKAVLVATKHLSDKDIDKSMKKMFKAAVQSLENGK
jgi:hypothetical protein